MGIYTPSLCQLGLCNLIFLGVLFCQLIFIQRGLADGLLAGNNYGKYAKYFAGARGITNK